MTNATRPLDSKVEVDFGSGFVDWNGTQDINCPDGANTTIKNYSLGDAVKSRKGSGCSEPGDLTFSYLDDPTDTTHQAVQDRALTGGLNSGAAIPVRVTIGSTGKIKTGSGTIVKHDEKGSEEGWMVDVEVALDGQWAITHPS